MFSPTRRRLAGAISRIALASLLLGGLALPALAGIWPSAGDVAVQRAIEYAEQAVPIGEPCRVTWSITPTVGQNLEGLFLSEQFPAWLEVDAVGASIDGSPVSVIHEQGAPGETEAGLVPHRFLLWNPESGGGTDLPEGSTLSLTFDLTSQVSGLAATDGNGWYGRLVAEPRRAVGGFLAGDDAPLLQFGEVPVTLIRFEAWDAGDHIQVDWELHVEGEDESAELRRGESADPYAATALQGEVLTHSQGFSYLDRAVTRGRDYWYWLAVLDAEGQFLRFLGPARGRLEGGAPSAQATLSSFPNPFNPRTTLRFELAEAGAVDLSVYDARGRRLRRLQTGTLPAGAHTLIWDGRDAAGRDLPSGTYLARLHTPGAPATLHKLTLLR